LKISRVNFCQRSPKPNIRATEYQICFFCCENEGFCQPVDSLLAIIKNAVKSDQGVGDFVDQFLRHSFHRFYLFFHSTSYNRFRHLCSGGGHCPNAASFAAESLFPIPVLSTVSEVIAACVSKTRFVEVDSNRYSVPLHYSGCGV